MTNKLEIMIDEELDDFYSNSEEDGKCFKLLLEFVGSRFNYKSKKMEIKEKEPKKAERAKVVDLSRCKKKGSKLF